MRLIVSPSNSPYWNCAAEKYILTELPQEALFLYINRPSVIVGRNQTIEAEVDVDYCRAAGIEIVRRLSGGGTVYHDLGNVNYAFITDRDQSSLLDTEFTRPIIDALASFGVVAHSGERRELLVDGLKISGTASHVIRKRQLAHGTLLYDADLDVLERVLRGREELRGKGVASVRSRVVNLSGLIEGNRTTEEFMTSLFSFFSDYYPNVDITPLDDSQIAHIDRICAELFAPQS